VLIDPRDPATARLLAQARQAAEALGFQFLERAVRTRGDIERVFGDVKPGDVQGVFVVSPSLHTNVPSLIVGLASKRHLPIPMHRKEWIAQGAIFSHGYNVVSVGRAAAVYVDRILHGAKPADLPVEQPTRFEMVVSRKAAKTLGLTIPRSVLLRADQVID
jgi:putative ABC transport system substrate-binding protein